MTDANPQGSVPATGELALHEAAGLLEGLAEDRPTRRQPTPEPDVAEVEEEQDDAEEADTETDDTEADASDDADSDDEGSEETETEADDEDAETVEVYRVKVNGEDVEVTLDELLSGYSRESDYRRKTTELAEQRRQFQAEAQAIAAQRQQFAEAFQRLEAEYKAIQGPEPDWQRLAQEDPIGFTIQKHQWDMQQQKLAGLRQQAEQAMQQQAAHRQQEYQQWLASENEKLVKAIPAWSDPQKGPQIKKEIAEYAKGLGLGSEQLANLDALSVLTLRKAMAYDKLQANKPGVMKKIVKAPKTVKPGTAQPKAAASQKVRTAKAALAKSGRVEDAARLFLLGD